MAQMVKAVKMILGMETFGSVKNGPADVRGDIEIEDDAPKRKPSLEEIDALEVPSFFTRKRFRPCSTALIELDRITERNVWGRRRTK